MTREGSDQPTIHLISYGLYRYPESVDGPASMSPLVETMTGSTTKAAFQIITISTKVLINYHASSFVLKPLPLTGNS